MRVASRIPVHRSWLMTMGESNLWCSCENDWVGDGERKERKEGESLRRDMISRSFSLSPPPLSFFFSVSLFPSNYYLDPLCWPGLPSPPSPHVRWFHTDGDTLKGCAPRSGGHTVHTGPSSGEDGWMASVQ
jgi:hypothetical protein